MNDKSVKLLEINFNNSQAFFKLQHNCMNCTKTVHTHQQVFLKMFKYSCTLFDILKFPFKLPSCGTGENMYCCVQIYTNVYHIIFSFLHNTNSIKSNTPNNLTFNMFYFVRENHIFIYARNTFPKPMCSPFYDDTAFMIMRSRQSPDSVRTAEDRERGEVREGRWRRIQ